MISLRVDDLTKLYNQPLLEKVNFSFTGQGVVGFIGDNGSGKSSFLKILGGVDEDFTGKFAWSGKPSIGFMPQEIMDRDNLSGGQKKMEKLAQLIYGENHDVLLLDEPTNHLDIKSIWALENFLSEYKGTVLLISHDKKLIRNVCEKIYQMEDGKIRLGDMELLENTGST